LYGVSKLAIDNWVATQNFKHPVQGMRFFNVYGRREGHKNQPSPVRRYLVQGIQQRRLTVYQHNDRLGSRDFISVDDCIDAMIRLKDSKVSGVFNIGTGRQLTFKDVAHAIQKHFGIESVQVQIVPMPDDMVKTYQWESRANLDKLKSVLPDWNPQTVEEWLDKNFAQLYNTIQEELRNEQN
jgi:ADP-L-glycero-D-manno-heptose 6-epimerase